MRRSNDCLGYQPIDVSTLYESADFGYYGLDSNIARALCGKSHLGYWQACCPWEKHANEFGYYGLNAGISRALKRVAGG
ncbi:MAG: hypothetical protein PVG19_13480 [Desulfobacterales bacterium]|jgi:hypothetical protein